jgi:hypothetical protein
MKQPPPLSDALAVLNMSTADLDHIAEQHAPDWETCNAELKRLINERRKSLAFELHPDRTGDDAEAGERMKAVNDTADMLMNHVIMGPPQPRPMFTQVIVVNMGGGFANTAGTSTGGGGFCF